MRTICILSLAIGITALPRLEAQPRPVNQTVVLSDFHFNPLANPDLGPQLAGAEPAAWEKLFRQDIHSPAQRYNEDGVFSLLASVVDAVRRVQPRPKLVVVTGDILTHHFREKFEQALGTDDPAAFRDFVRKTVAFIGLEMEHAAGGVPVIYTLGNNDDECGDYALQPSGPFLRDAATAVQRLAQIDDKAMESWLTLGSYAASNPLIRNGRIVALNTGFWSSRYTNACGQAADGDPGAALLAFLSSQLADAEKAGAKVWLAYHIPPGIDGHSSARANHVVPMWKQVYSDGFNQLIDRYRKTVTLNLAAHTHLDDFRLVETSHAVSLVLLNPGVSPNVGQNPAFRLITVNGRGRPEDVLTYYLPDLNSPNWQLEYSTRPAFGLKRIDAASYQALYKKIGDVPAMSQLWRQYYAISRLSGLSNDPRYQQALHCATGHADVKGFEACMEKRQ